MYRKLLVAFLIMAISVTSGAAQIGARKKGDPRVRALLDKADLKYSVDSDGDFRLVIRFDNGRSQVVFILSRTAKLHDMEIREVFSVGYVSDDEVSGEVANNLLRENRNVKLGAWELGRFNDKECAVFRAKIAADTDVKTILIALQAVSKTADEKEKELLGTDRL